MPADRARRWLIVILLLGLFVRLPILPAKGWERDMHWFKVWSLTAAEHGVTKVADETWCDYPPAYLYVLKGLGHLHRALEPEGDDESPLLHFLLKLPATLADLLLAWLIFRWLRKPLGDKKALLGAGLWAFNPLVVYESAYWGQVDSVSALLILLTVRLIWTGRNRAGGLVGAVALLTKLQTVIFLPVLAVLVWRRDGYRAVLGTIGAGLFGLLLVCLPFFLTGNVSNATAAFSDAVGRYPYLSLNAHNVWWIASGADGMSASDLPHLVPGLSYRTAGLLAFALFYVALLAWYARRPRGEGGLLLALAAAAFGFYVLPTQMHERYVFPTFVFLALLAPRHRAWLGTYVVLSLVSFATLVVALTLYWPQNQQWLADLVTPIREPLTLGLAWINVAAAGLALLYFARGAIKVVIPVLAAGALLVWARTASYEPKPVWLSDLEPLSAGQGWGDLTKDRSVDGATLSVNGFRYRKGLGSHAPSELSYHLGGRYKTFEAWIGIQYANNRNTEVAFEVWGGRADGTNERLFASGPLKGWIDPIPIRISVEGMEKLWLLTSEGSDGKNNDHTIWAGARLLP